MYTKILTCFLFVIFFGSINAQSEIIIIYDLSLKVDRDQTRYLVQNKIIHEITFHNDKKFYENQLQMKINPQQSYCEISNLTATSQYYVSNGVDFTFKQENRTGIFRLKNGAYGTNNPSEYAGLEGKINGDSATLYMNLLCYEGYQKKQVKSIPEINNILKGILQINYDFDLNFELPFFSSAVD